MTSAINVCKQRPYCVYVLLYSQGGERQISSDIFDAAIYLMSHSATKVGIQTAPCQAVSQIPPIHVQLMQPPALTVELYLSHQLTVSFESHERVELAK
jgi:hypothetical protein